MHVAALCDIVSSCSAATVFDKAHEVLEAGSRRDMPLASPDPRLRITTVLIRRVESSAAGWIACH